MICGHSLAKCRAPPLVNFYFPLVPFFHSSRFFKLKTITRCLKVFPQTQSFSHLYRQIIFLLFFASKREIKLHRYFFELTVLRITFDQDFNEFLRYWADDITSLNNCRSIVVRTGIGRDKASKTNEFCFRLKRRSLIKRWSKKDGRLRRNWLS